MSLEISFKVFLGKVPCPKAHVPTFTTSSYDNRATFQCKPIFQKREKPLQPPTFTLDMASNTLELRGVLFIFTLLSILHFGKSQEGCSQIADAYRFDCYPEDGASEQNCLNRGCCWRPPSAEVDGKVPLNIPYCFYPTNYGYKLVNKEKTQTGYLLRLVKQGHPGPYGKDVENLTVDVRFETRERLHFKVS